MELLPNDILYEIFDYVDKGSIRNVVKVCRRWQNLIVSSTNLMKKLEICVRPTNIELALKDYADIQLKSIMIHAHPLKTNDEMKQFEKQLKIFIERKKSNIEFAEMVYIYSCFFFNIISKFANLTHLNLISGTNAVNESLETKNIKISFPKLKILGLKNSTQLLKFFKPQNLEVLKVIDNGGDKTNQHLSEFLKLHKNLKEFKFMGFIPQLTNVDLFPFKLQSFSVLLKGQTETDTSSIFALIRSQKDNLRELKLIGFNTKDFIEYSINELKLTKLEFDMTRIRTDLSKMKVNRTVKTLLLQSIALSINQMQKVIEVCPNVEDLRIVSNTNMNFSHWVLKASESMMNLKHLSLDSLLGILLPQNLTFKSLETLTVSKLGSDAQILGWIQLVSRCPNVKKIIVTGFGLQFITLLQQPDSNDVTYLSKNNLQYILISVPHLEEIELRGKFTLTDEVVDVLSSNMHSLKKFKFASEIDDDLLRKVRRLNESKVQVTIMKTGDGKKTIKRKLADME